MWKKIFYFTKNERSGLIFLIILIAGIFAGKAFLVKPQNQLPENEITKSDTVVDNFQYKTTGDKENKTKFYNDQKNPKIENYKKEPEKRTYFQNRSENSSKTNDSTRNFNKINKLEPGSKIDLNTADTTLMMRVPGIGQSYATRILKYRKMLGGFYSVEQLKEVYGMYEELYEKIISYFEISSENILRISINKTSLDQLRAHPYIDFYQAKAIVELRKKNGTIDNLETLSMLEEFPEEKIEKIKHYLSFE
ncbi:MAG: helix-hairpin-helix domain-containing protein [Dysgonamonadaceae bacterium]|jgi:competence ComEA-like helix-hairpin-helix protein|nr:helix-hairpin-helix domain-containing protein [Dysgonamonadaceae bacterium]